LKDRILRILLKRKNVTITELSNRLETSNQNMANKHKRDNFSTNELNEIAEVLNCEFEGFFVDKEGNRI